MDIEKKGVSNKENKGQNINYGALNEEFGDVDISGKYKFLFTFAY